MKQIKFSTDKIMALVDYFNNKIDEIECPKNHAAARALIEDVGERFFSAPASGRLMYHNCCVGGLLEHSIRVHTIFSDLCEKYHEVESKDDIIIAALFHDIGKIGTLDQDYYVPKNSKWHEENMGLYYESNPKLRFMPHAQRSLQLLGQYEFNLVNDVYTGILIHDGQYVDENKPYKMKEGKFPLLLHMADRLACEIEKEKWEELNGI